MKYPLYLFALTACAQIAPANFDPSEYALRKDILFEPNSGETLVAAPIDSEIYDSIRTHMPDIRVVSSGTEVPFLIEKAIETRTRIIEKIAPASVVSLRELPGNRIEMNIELEEDAPNADVLRIHTPLSDYERRVNVFGSTDGESWIQLASGSLVFDYSRYFDIENNEVALPENGHRHFRVVIEDIVDEKASPFRRLWLRSIGDDQVEHAESFTLRNRPFRIDRIELWAQREKESFKSERTGSYKDLGFTVSNNENERQTTVEIDSGREPLQEFSVGTSDRNFSRKAQIEVRKQVHATTDWVEIGAATLSAINYLDFSEETLSIGFPEHRASKYRLIIANQDNAPLAVNSITAAGRIYQIVFIGEPDRSYQIYYDSDKAEAPRYDIATVLAPIRHTFKPAEGSFGPETPNPIYDAESDRARSRLLENRLFLGVAIAAMVLVLAWALYSTSRKLNASPPSSSDSDGE